MKGAYFSDLIFPEEQENEQESAFKGLRGLTEQATSIFHINQPEDKNLATQPMESGPENSKEFVELNFAVKYTGDEEKPVQA